MLFAAGEPAPRIVDLQAFARKKTGSLGGAH
jgi:hypothetical protein